MLRINKLRSKNFILVATLCLILALGIFIGIKQDNKVSKRPIPSASSSSESILKTFKSSEVLDFTVDLPSKYEINEKLGSTTITTGKGEIYIDKNGTNFNNLDDYIKDLRMKNKLKLVSEKRTVINNYQALIEIVSIPGDEKNTKEYFIFVNDRVYLMRTNKESLYSDLDQIAQSFRYTP